MNNMDPKDIGIRIRDIRNTLDLKQKNFARGLGLSPSFLSEIEAGRSKPGYDFLYNAFVKYNINPVYILTGKETMFKIDESSFPAFLLEKYGELSAEVAAMLTYMEKSSIVRHGMLMDFKAMMLKKEKIISAEIGEAGSNL